MHALVHVIFCWETHSFVLVRLLKYAWSGAPTVPLCYQMLTHMNSVQSQFGRSADVPYMLISTVLCNPLQVVQRNGLVSQS